IIISAAESVSYDKDYNLLNEIPKETEVYRVGHKEPLGKLSKGWQILLSNLRVSYNFPDYYRSWRSPALREAKRVLNMEKVDLIYSASPPFTTAFVAMKLKRELGIPWVADFLDGWAVNDFLRVYYDEALVKPLRDLQKYRVKRGENSIIVTADKTVVISWHVKQRLCELHKVEGRTIDVVNDGYEESVFEKLIARPLYPDSLTIVFLGSFYAPFKEPVIRFVKIVNEISKEAEVVFIGRGAAAMQAVTKVEATYILNLPRKKALAFALGSDFLFVVMPPYAKWIPTKIYDYLRLGKPILALVPADGDAAKIIQEARGGFVLSYEPEDMKRQLKSIFEEWRQGKFKDFHPDWEYVAQFERRKLVQKIAAIFDEVVHKEATEIPNH
ncbi:MAG TPA: glycosyltransferase, partial [Dehalococcoidia bacterium]|nr:glycosyltransferase [Dehalococcoidia bacterium]